jgi:SEC-C motif
MGRPLQPRPYVAATVALLSTLLLTAFTDLRLVTALVIGVLGGFLAYVFMNVPPRYRSFGWGHVQQASDHRLGQFGNTYHEDPIESGETSRERIGRNQPCPCGSGRKYKHCHGAAH